MANAISLSARFNCPFRKTDRSPRRLPWERLGRSFQKLHYVTLHLSLPSTWPRPLPPLQPRTPQTFAFLFRRCLARRRPTVSGRERLAIVRATYLRPCPPRWNGRSKRGVFERYVSRWVRAAAIGTQAERRDWSGGGTASAGTSPPAPATASRVTPLAHVRRSNVDSPRGTVFRACTVLCQKVPLRW